MIKMCSPILTIACWSLCLYHCLNTLVCTRQSSKEGKERVWLVFLVWFRQGGRGQCRAGHP